MVRSNVVLEGAAHVALNTLMVSTTLAPLAISAALKLYVGVSVLPLRMEPTVPEVVLAAHEIVPFAEEYPAGTVKKLFVVHAVPELVAP